MYRLRDVEKKVAVRRRRRRQEAKHQIKNSRSPFSLFKWEDRKREQLTTKEQLPKVLQDVYIYTNSSNNNNFFCCEFNMTKATTTSEMKKSRIKFTANGIGTREIVYQETRDIITYTRNTQQRPWNIGAVALWCTAIATALCSLLLWPVWREQMKTGVRSVGGARAHVSTSAIACLLTMVRAYLKFNHRNSIWFQNILCVIYT